MGKSFSMNTEILYKKMRTVHFDLKVTLTIKRSNLQVLFWWNTGEMV